MRDDVRGSSMASSGFVNRSGCGFEPHPQAWSVPEWRIGGARPGLKSREPYRFDPLDQL